MKTFLCWGGFAGNRHAEQPPVRGAKAYARKPRDPTTTLPQPATMSAAGDLPPRSQRTDAAHELLRDDRTKAAARPSQEEYAMANPWLKKNPFMSMWLSGAHSVANSARGQVAAAAKRQTNAAVTQATHDMFSLWTGALASAAKPPPKMKRRR
jgi:hypothetical protein